METSKWAKLISIFFLPSLTLFSPKTAVLTRLQPNPDGYVPVADIIATTTQNLPQFGYSGRLIWDLIDRIGTYRNPGVLKIVNEGEGGDGNGCSVDSNGKLSCGPFQYQQPTWNRWSKESDYDFAPKDISNILKQIDLTDWVVSQGHLCIFGTAWNNPRIIKKLRHYYGAYKCTKSSDIFYPSVHN